MAATSSKAVIMLVAASGSIAVALITPDYRWPKMTDHEPLIPLYMRAPSLPSTMATTVSLGKGLLAATRDCSDMFPPLKIALAGLLIAWDRFESTADVQKDFLELASKLAPVKAMVTRYREPVNENLRMRFEAISLAVEKLTEEIEAKTERGLLLRAAQSTGDVETVKKMFRRVSSLLEVFQFEGQVATETMLSEILERLKTQGNQSLPCDGEPATAGVSVINRNRNRTKVDGSADVANHNQNDTDLEIFARSKFGILNENDNATFVGHRQGFSSTESDAVGRSEATNLWPRTRIYNGNGNNTVVKLYSVHGEKSSTITTQA